LNEVTIVKATIRKMRQEDLAEVYDLAMLANPHADKEKYKEHVSDELKENPDLSLVVTVDGKVVGYIQAEVQDDSAVLEDIAIAKEYQNKELGKTLLYEEIEALKRKGAKTVFAEVHYMCASAIPFYYKHDFRIIGFMQDYFGIGHDAIILKLVLQQPEMHSHESH
jgi:ribosomal protein S18 acetylase RimI-like enzyme